MAREKLNLDLIDMSEYPRSMRTYLKNYGFHFNKKACDEAVKGLRRLNPATGKPEPLEPRTKEQVEEILKQHNIRLENNVLYDFVWVYHMILSDYWKSSVADEQHLALMVRDIVDDCDQNDGFIFNRWLSDRLFNGCPIEWDELI